MLRWLKRVLGGDKVTGGLSDDALAFVREEVTRLDPLGGGLADDVLRYVITGEGHDVLGRLASTPGAAEAFGLKARRTGDIRVRPIRCIGDPAVLLRLARAWAATLPSADLGKLPGGALPPWLETLVWESSSVSPRGSGRFPVESSLDGATLAALLAESGDEEADVVRWAVGDTIDFGGLSTGGLPVAIEGIGDMVARHPGVVEEALADTGAERLAALLLRLLNMGVAPDVAPERFAELLCDTRKTVRGAALRLLPDGLPAVLVPHVERVLREGKPAARHLAALRLLEVDDAALRDRLREHVADERSTKVRTAIEEGLAAPAAAPLEPASFDIPPRQPVAPPAPLTRDQRVAIERYAAALETRRREMAAEYPTAPRFRTPIDVEQAVRAIEDSAPWSEEPGGMGNGIWGHRTDLEECLQAARWPLVTLLRTIAAGSEYVAGYTLRAAPFRISSARERQGETWDLRALAEAATWLGYDEEDLLSTVLDSWGFGYDWGDDAAWPYVAEHLGALTAKIRDARLSQDWAYARERTLANSYRLLRTLPHLPAEVLPELWDAAFQSTQLGRAGAQALLEEQPDRNDRIAAHLADGKVAIRVVAADWAARTGDAALVPALAAAMEKERTDGGKAALLTALEALGESIEPYLDRSTLLAEAEKGLKRVAKAARPALDVTLPAVRWRDADEHVEPEIVRWWLVKAAKLKSPEPDPLLRRYVSRLRDDDRLALGEAVLRAWIAEDVRAPTEVTAADEKAIRKHAQEWLPYYPELTLEQLVDRNRRVFLVTPVGSAASWKGALAVAAACRGPHVAPVVEAYLREWYGMRASQCRALLAVLAWADDQAATQVLLATARRFRTEGIRKEAARLVEELAAWRGWTPDELADRTLPDAGFDDDGRQTIEYRVASDERPDGAKPEVSRTFTLRLTRELKVVIESDGGKAIMALPAARKSEDAASVKAAKKELSAAKRNVTKIVTQQRTRLHEALCTQRAWSAADWSEHLLGHPIVGRICRRLVWSATPSDAADDDRSRDVWFRPLEDGSLTDAADDEVLLSGDETVRIAHGSLMPEEAVDAWREHLADFEVEPLVDAFPAALADVPDDLAKSTKVESVRGHIVNALALRGAASRRGYERGEAQDGGWVFSFEKPFPTLRLSAVIEFSGSPQPFESRDVALVSAYVERLPPEEEEYGRRTTLALDDVPAVLLAELRADLAALAAQGEGFDPDWEKRVEY